ncbi:MULTISPECIES: 2-oxo acid dehydrogenase subunit E2 [Halomonadaceae]|uniref:2-oxo acid dehydrogenase subunit E2 n=1 Tax=Halomonadaceae TaxID=28256 RepID=UPI0015974F30|nr:MULTISPECIES: 2-oxo acid dehydrogenase subunit E2 [Halomonas]QJQ94379.1 dihydrolipoyllysine-residue acetyltransferase [Halomonas sp. PA5]
MSDFMLPDIGEGIVECEVVKWLVAEGETIEEDQPVVEVMTDKALVEITAPEPGQVTRLYYAQGESAKVHSALFAYESLHESAPGTGSHAARDNEASERAANEVPAAPHDADVRHADADVLRASQSGGAGSSARIPASPAVRRLVRELGVSLERIPGSGKEGRVLKEDVLAWQRANAIFQGDERPKQPSPDERGGGGAPRLSARVEPLKGMRAVMARRMVESSSTIPHFAYGDEIDVTALLTLREQLKVQAETYGVRLTLMPLLLKAMALAVQDYPLLNARLDEEASEIRYQPHCNIGMAVDGQAGLMVPNVKRTERLTLLEIAAEVARLTEAARQGRVEQGDLKEGTISISNIGALGGTYATPIINAPEVAIVAIGRTQWLPRFDEQGQVVSRAIMTITWSGDHRVLDGGTIARFCNCWKAYLEAPHTMLLRLG